MLTGTRSNSFYRRRYAAEAARGAALLEAQFPGALTRVDPETLNMASTTRCILGQVFAHRWSWVSGLSMGYTRKLAALGLNRDTQAHFGFSLYEPGTSTEWESLADAWRDELEYRKNPGVFPEYSDAV